MENEYLSVFREFCKKEIQPFAEEWDAKAELPGEIFTKLAQVGYSGIVVPEEYGGGDLGIPTGVRAMEILSEHCGSTFFSASASFGLFGEPLKHFGTAQQKERYYLPVLEGKKIGCLAITEPHSGSDVSSLKTSARIQADGKIRLNGQKTYITNSSIADYCIVLARLFDANDRDIGLTHIILDLDNPNIGRGKPMKKLGLKASPTGELFFEDAIIDGEIAILGGKGKGFRQTMMTFNEERLSIAAFCLGIVNACLSESLSFSKTRESFGKPIHEHQSVSNMIAELYTIREAVKSFTYRLADEMEENEKNKKIGKPQDRELPAKCSALKLFASEQAREATNLAVQIHGGAGFMEEYRVARLYRDIRLAEIGGGTSEIQKSIIAGTVIKRL